MAKATDPSTIAAKWARNTGSQAAQDAYKAGISALTVSPTQLAAAPDAQQRYVDGVKQSVDSGRRAAKLNAVDIGTYKQVTLAKGPARLASGAQAAQGKFQAFATKYAPVWQQIRATVSGMPKGGIDNALARVRASIEAMQHAAGK